MLSLLNLVKWRTTQWESSIESTVHNIVNSITNYDKWGCLSWERRRKMEKQIKKKEIEKKEKKNEQQN